MSSTDLNDTQFGFSLDPGKHVEFVFGADAFVDRRLRKRVAQLWSSRAAQFDSCGAGESQLRSRADRRGAQRLYVNERIDTDTLVERGRDFTLNVSADSTLTVAMHDSSEVNLAGRWEPEDAGPLRSNAARGYMVHAIVLVDAEHFVSRGILAATAWERSWKLTRNDQSRPAHQKESFKWKRGLMLALETAPEQAREWIHVFDREGDVHENFEYAIAEGLKIVVGARSEHRIAEAGGRLWRHMARRPVLDTRELTMIANASGKRETRSLGIRVAQVTLLPAKKNRSHRDREPVTLTAVYVKEKNSKREWMLLTTCQVDRADDAWRIFDAYRARTVGEEAFKALKTGLEIESESIGDLEAFRRKLAILLPLATLMFQWRWLSRHAPSANAAEHVDAATLQLMKAAARLHRLKLPRGRWSTRTLVQCLAQLGGYEPRKDQSAGWLTIWRGWHVFSVFRRTAEFLRTPGADSAN